MRPPRHRLLTRFLSLLFCIAACAGSGFATTVLVPSDEEMAIGARAIVRARVSSLESDFDEGGSMVYTYVTLRVEEVIKGAIFADSLVLRQPGGESGEHGTLVSGAPAFAPGEHVLVYLDSWPDGSLRVHQMYLGKFSIVRDPATGVETAVRGRPVETPGLVGRSISGSITDRLELREYVRMLRSQLDANGERARRFEQAHYAGVPLLANPPEREGASEGASGGAINLMFTRMAPGLCWFAPFSGGAVSYEVNTDGASFPDVQADIAAAANVWSSLPGSSLRLTSAGVTARCGPTADKISVVFNNCDGRWSPSFGCSGVLAQTRISYSTSQTRVVNGQVFHRVTSAVISFNPYARCFLRSHCHVQEVAAHEFGHAIGLDHTQGVGPEAPAELDSTMYAVIHFDGRCAGLRRDDIAGAQFIYPATNHPPGPAIVTGAPLHSTTMGNSYLQALSAIEGAPPYTWSLDSGQLPPGININSEGRLSGVPSTAGTFTFTLRLADSVSGSAKKTVSIRVADSPRIKAVKYKAKKGALVVKGERLESSALLVDGRQVDSTGSARSVVAKGVRLSTGMHEIKLVDSKGQASEPFFIEID